MRRMRGVSAVLCALAVFVVFAAPASGEGARAVKIVSSGYEPTVVNGALGMVVKWTNKDFRFHTATSDDPLPNGEPGIRVFDTGQLAQNQSAQRRLPWAATFPYHCVYHAYMEGRVSTRMTIVDASTEEVVRYRVRWAVDDPKSGTQFDVQVRPPGGKFESYYRGTARSRLFAPDAGGTWAFRARLVKMDGSHIAASTLFSPLASVEVTLPAAA